MNFRGLWILCLLLCLSGAAFGAEWYESYDKGSKLIDKGNCKDGAPLVQDALAKNGKADLKARPYGMISLEYVPQYYLAKCALASGDYAGAKQYADAATLQVDMYSSSKSADFRQIRKQLDQKFGGQQGQNTTQNTTNQQNNTTGNTGNTGTTGNTGNTGNTGTTTNTQQSGRQAIINRNLADAQMAYANGDYDSARDGVDRVLALDASNSGALRLREQIVAKEAASQRTQLRQQRINEARRALNRGDFGSAETLVLELRASYPDDKTVNSLSEEISRTKAEKMKTMQADDFKKSTERQIIGAFYTGKYNAVIELADQAASQYPDSWRVLFYQGCAYAALGILESSNQDQRLTRARESFRKAKTVAGGEITPPPQISPKIWDVYRSS